MKDRYIRVKVQFPDYGGLYIYYSDILDLRVGDFVVLITENFVPKVAEVRCIMEGPLPSEIMTTAIVHSRIELGDYSERVERLYNYTELHNKLGADNLDSVFGMLKILSGCSDRTFNLLRELANEVSN